jgi:SAM-dependent methyltransferase
MPERNYQKNHGSPINNGSATPLYVHGRSGREAERLSDQAMTLADLLHHDTRYPAGSRVLEAGCGVGAQTVILAKNSPDTRFTSIDISTESLGRAKTYTDKEGITNVDFRQADVYNLPGNLGMFDHAFSCFLLEHVPDPHRALLAIMDRLVEGGTITVIEGDHGSAFFHPDSPEAHQAIGCLVEIQKRMGGNALIGRELYHLLDDAGLRKIRVTPRTVYVDATRPLLIEGFTRNTFTAMVEGVRDQAIGIGLIDEATWEKGIRDLERTTARDGSFCYTFFKGVAVKKS